MVNTKAVREYFYDKVRDAGSGEWYPTFWAVPTWSEYVGGIQES